MILGTGTLAQLLDFHMGADSHYEVVGFTASQPPDTDRFFLGRPLVPLDKVTEVFPPSDHAMFVAVGYRKRNKIRARLCQAASRMGYELITYVSPSAHRYDDLVTGENCCILGESTLEPFVTIGDDVVIKGGAYISHHTSIGDHCFIAPRAAIASGTRIGNHCFIGINATIRDGISVADECLVGAGTVILEDTDPGSVYIAGPDRHVTPTARDPSPNLESDL